MKFSPFHTISKKKLALSIAASLALGSGISNIALAQDDEEDVALEEITVTGTRIRSDDFSNAQPSTVVDSALLDNLGIVNLGDAMASLPSNVGNNTPTANAGGNFFNGSNIANLRGLNPFFGSRTLTLVDSRRHVPTNQGDGVDLNFIPSVLIDRMEVVTGGASASYGSGAIGGVTNILLDRDLEGGKIQVDYGVSGEDDGEDVHIGFAWGSQIGENGHFIFGFEGQDAGGIGSCMEARDWCADNVAVVTNDAWTNDGVNGPRYLIKDRVGSNSQQVSGRPIFGITNTTCTDDSCTAYRAWDRPNEYDQGGEGRPNYQYTNMRSPVEREVFYSAYTHEISDDMTFFIEGSMGSVDTFTPQGSLDTTFGFLAPDNFYLNRLQAAGSDPCPLQAFGVPCFFNKNYSDEIDTYNETTTDLTRFSLGLSGRFGDTTWTWDTYYQYGESDRTQLVNDNLRLESFGFALDAVDDGNGNPVCRFIRDGIPPGFIKDPALLTGCKPINILQPGMINESGGQSYAWGRLLEETTVEQDMFEFVASGEVFEGFGAGPIRAAAGASYRDESIANISDPGQPDYARRDYLIQYGESFSGEVAVLEYFVEAQIPFTETFDVQLAARQSSYENTAGLGTPVPGDTFDYDITTWKVTGNWQATDYLRLRGSLSRDIRAPNFRELYYGQDLQRGGPFGFCSNEWTGNVSQGFFTNTGDPCTVELRGGLDLQPEVSDTVTFGVVLTPADWNVRFAVDYFSIEIEDAITPANSGLVLDGCFDGILAYCQQITGTPFDANDLTQGYSQIDKITPTAANFRAYEANGFDVSADWIGEFDFGTISSRLIGSRMLQQLIQPTATDPSLIRNIAGTTGQTNGFLSDWSAAPGWSVQWINTYINGPLTLTASASFIKEGQMYADRIGPEDSGYSPSNPNSIESNRIPNYVNWALNAGYSFTVADVDMQVFGNINNLFDKAPPMTGTGTGGSANPTFYDTIGRNFRVGLRANF